MARFEWLLLSIACQAASSRERDPALAALEVPTDWHVVREATRVSFEDPERGLRVVIAVSEHVEARDAITEGWLQMSPAILFAPSSLDAPPPTGGWDAEATIEYALPAASGRAAYATWRKLGPRSYVMLVDADAKVLARRQAQITTLAGSLRPAGLRDEVLGGPVRAVDPARLDAFVERALSDLAVPGAAVAVIVDGKVAYERVLGVRELGKPAPVTVDTRFLLASVTKPMTTLMQAALVDAKVVRWDSPVVRLLPTFALGDPTFTRDLVLWQMSCACTGMPREDMPGLFEWTGVTPDARLATMRTMKPTTKVGETFQYSNPMVAAGGYAAAHAYAPDRSLADAYAAVMAEKIFRPIGMSSTTLDFATVAAGEHALPHALALDGTTRVMPLAIERAVEPIAPAGGAWTTLRDFERYAMTELAEGVAPDGARVVSAENLRERSKRRVRRDDHEGYGLGLGVHDYRGLRVLSHDGGALGFGTTLYLLPDLRAGIVILTNIRNGNAKEQLPFNSAVTRRIVEELFAARPLADHQLAYYVTLRKRTPPISADHAWIAALAGSYREPILGTVELRDTPSGPVLDAGEWRSHVVRVVEADGSAKLVLLDPPFAGGAILIGAGDPATLVVPDQTTYTFRRD